MNDKAIFTPDGGIETTAGGERISLFIGSTKSLFTTMFISGYRDFSCKIKLTNLRLLHESIGKAIEFMEAAERDR